jgi:hypothetical protein
MLDKLIKRFQKAGKIRKQKAGIVQIEALLREAILDLEEAKNIYHMIQNGAYSQKEWAFVFRLT